MPEAKKHPELAGFTIPEVRLEARVNKQTIVNFINGGGKRKGELILSAIERLKARRVAALQEEKARIEKAIQQVTSQI